MSAKKPLTIPPFRQSAIEIASDLSIADMSIWCGLSRNKLMQHVHDAVDPLPSYNVGRKILINKQQYREWITRRFSSANPDPAIVPPRRRRRKAA